MIHNLDLDNAEYFEFILKGHTYRMRYPSPKELKEIGEEKDPKVQEQKVYDYIEPVTPDAPVLKELLEIIPINVLNKFNKMVTEEFMGTVNGA